MNIFDSHEFISRNEYNEFRENRLHPNELIVDELYILMLALNKHPVYHGRDAIRYPIVCTKPSFEDMGIWIINYNPLNQDLKPNNDMKSVKFNQEKLIKATRRFSDKIPSIAEGYLKPFDDGLSIDLQMLIIEQSIKS